LRCVIKSCFFLNERAACLHADRNDPTRGGKLAKKDKVVRLAGVRAMSGREEEVLMHREGGGSVLANNMGSSFTVIGENRAALSEANTM